MGLDKDLGFCTDDELKAKGYWRDGIGQVRKSGSNELVCGRSGRLHIHYLLPFPQFVKGGEAVPFYIDKQSAQEIGLVLKGKFGAAGAGLVSHGGNLLRQAFEILLSRFLPKF